MDRLVRVVSGEGIWRARRLDCLDLSSSSLQVPRGSGVIKKESLVLVEKHESVVQVVVSRRGSSLWSLCLKN